MRGIYACLLFVFAVSAQVSAQEIDTVPITVKDFDLKLRKSPLPSLKGIIVFKPVEINPLIVSSKVNYWKTKTAIGINVNQSSFSNNWSGGGVNSLAVEGLVNYKAEYKKENYSYLTEVDLRYGKIRNKGQIQKKTNDRIFWNNTGAFKISKNWNLFTQVTFESQFDNGYSYSSLNGVETPLLISKFMSPGYLTESFGFEYKPNKYFSTQFGTGAAKQTFVLDNRALAEADRNANPDPANQKTDFYGVPVGDTFKNDLAFQITVNFEKDIFHNVNLKSRYYVFVPYDHFENMKHRLDVTLTTKVNRFMNVTLNGVGIYDKTISDRIQGSQSLAMGVMFIFPR
ncbi:hypothetical protein AY601_4144 [Pedobacter cryoconitis]|uniref:DUF3078 domain-containing protein n=1 Tax=Pedobacter cryoconitis TaxID=188932 RepID=A0A127VI42_9SPHI|nr:DUF3078 domain-containing protein [Pedobacter cryoconitis]AMQ00995.1 hypothetical protein AY601_4144 [Pedobacter cryoconitis]